MPSAAARPPGFQFDRAAATLAALVVVGLAVFLLVRNQPIADPKLFFVLRVVLSFSAATLGATIPGFLDIRWSGSGFALRAGGALALFVLTFVYTPDVLANQGGKTETTISAPDGVGGTATNDIAMATAGAEADVPPPSSPPQAPLLPQPLTVDQALATLKLAMVAFNTPEHARVAKTLVIEASISTHLRKTELQVLIDEPGKIEIGNLKVSDRMASTLIGSAFDISPSGPQEQWVSDTEVTSWRWQVTPKTVGEQVMILSFDALININGKDDRRTINTFKRIIKVDVGFPETFGEWLELVKHTGENISWIWTTLLVLLGGSGIGGTWAWIKRHRRPPTGDNSGVARPLDDNPSGK